MTILHICGNMIPVLEDMAGTGAQILELDAKVIQAMVKAACCRRGVRASACLENGQ